jgi:UDP:flavonoid glycosyltransferase YjiC (YdhE family)
MYGLLPFAYCLSPVAFCIGTMRITLIAIGSHGDIRPMVALGVGLARSGHQVRLATTGDQRAFVAAHGLEWGPVNIDYQAMLQHGLGPIITQAGANLPYAMWRINRMLRPLIARVQHDLWAAVQGAECIISGLPIIGQDLAEALGVPFIAARLHPNRTGAMPGAYWPWGALPHGWLCRRTYDLADQLAWQPLRNSVNHWRTQHLGLPPAPFWGPFAQMRAQRDLVLHAYSPATIARPPDWGDHEVVTGFWWLPTPSWRPPPQLTAFLEHGPPPVYVGFGSMVSAEASRVGELVVAALRRCGQRGVLATGWGGLAAAHWGNDMCVIHDAPHDWLFPQMRAVVHHGGAGTVAAALRAGVPQVGVPAWGDQIFWSRRAAALGVGPAPIPRTQLRAVRLAAAVEQAVSEPQMRRRAADLAAVIAAEDGVGTAVAEITLRVGRA